MRIVQLALIAIAAASVPSQSAPPELHEFYGTLTFEDGQQLTGGPAIQPGQMIYMDALGTRELVTLRSAGEDTMASAELGLQVRWSRDAQGRLIAVDFIYDDGRRRSARFKGTRSEPIEIENEGDYIRGRLHLPRGNGPHPAMVLISGSGDSTGRFGTFVTFFVNLGMAVVAFDKRGGGASEGDWCKASLEVLAEDVARFVDALGDRPDIDRKRIGLLGHSEGGWVAPITAAKRTHVAFVLVRVGPAVPPPDVTQYGLHHIGVRSGISGRGLEAWDRLSKILTDALRDGVSFDTMQKNLEPLRRAGWLARWSPGGGLLDNYQPVWGFRVRNAHHDPAKYLSAVRAPVLWFLGETDTKVQTTTTAAALQESLAKHPDATVVVLPGIDHTFVVKGESGAKTYAPGFWGRIKEWLSSRGLTAVGAIR